MKPANVHPDYNDPADLCDKEAKCDNDPADLCDKGAKCDNDPADLCDKRAKCDNDSTDLCDKGAKCDNDPADLYDEGAKCDNDPADLCDKGAKCDNDPADLCDEGAKCDDNDEVCTKPVNVHSDNNDPAVHLKTLRCKYAKNLCPIITLIACTTNSPNYNIFFMEICWYFRFCGNKDMCLFFDGQFQANNYELYHQDRNHRGGGVIMYINDCIPHIVFWNNLAE